MSNNTATIERIDPEYLISRFGIGNTNAPKYKWVVVMSDGSYLDCYLTKQAAIDDCKKYGISASLTN